jgi:hypothetical protein
MQENFKLKPYTLVIRTTERCNVGCYHCSISATPRGQDISVDIAEKAIEDAKRLGLSRIHLTGGEPLLYEDLPALISKAKQEDIIVDMTSSTFTKTNEDTIYILNNLHKQGLCCVMLSYDAPHAHRVSLEHFCNFAKTAQYLGMEVCVFVTEEKNKKITVNSLKHTFVAYGIDIYSIEWTNADYQYEGRGEKQQPTQPKQKQTYPRCPYVMAVPTLNPDGRILLCHCAKFSTPNFTVGQYPQQSMSEILANMEHNIIYRYLAKYGPQQALANIGVYDSDIPYDMCRACNKYLTLLENIDIQERLEEVIQNDDLSVIAIDFKAILSTYKQHLQIFGEPVI